MEEEKQVLFKVGKEVYGININHVKGIEKYSNITPVPNAPEYIDGIINLRGEIIPVFSLRKKFGLPPAEITDETKLIIANSKGVATAFQVDKVWEIIEISSDKMNNAPAIVHSEQTGYIGKIAKTKDGLAILLNLDGVLTKEEQAAVEQVLSDKEAS